MNNKQILTRLKKLEACIGNNLPIVKARYQNGEIMTFYGAPPIEEIVKEYNHIVETFGSEFADLINAIVNPLPERYIENFEKESESTDTGKEVSTNEQERDNTREDYRGIIAKYYS